MFPIINLTISFTNTNMEELITFGFGWYFMKKKSLCIFCLVFFALSCFGSDYYHWKNTKKMPNQNYEYDEECYISKSSGMSKENFFEICQENFEEAVFDNFMENVSIKLTMIYTSQGSYSISFSTLNGNVHQVSVIFCEYGKNAEQLYRNIYVDEYDVAFQDYQLKAKKYLKKIKEM